LKPLQEPILQALQALQVVAVVLAAVAEVLVAEEVAAAAEEDNF